MIPRAASFALGYVDGGSIAIEESVYAGHDGVRRTEQLVLSGQLANEPIETAWIFEQIGTE